jgi:hypothetical protein
VLLNFLCNLIVSFYILKYEKKDGDTVSLFQKNYSEKNYLHIQFDEVNMKLLSFI